MVVTYVMVAVCVVGVLGAVASVLSYDNQYNEMRIPRHSRGRRQRARPRGQGSRPSRQLQAVEAALEEEAADPGHAAAPLARPPGARGDERPPPRRRGDRL